MHPVPGAHGRAPAGRRPAACAPRACRRRWVQGRADGAALLALADVIVSTDVTAGSFDNDKSLWGINNEMNTGMLLMRSTVGAMAVCRAWVDRMQLEMVKIEKLPKNMLQASLTSLTPRFAHPLHAHSSHLAHALLPTCHTPSFAYFCSPVVE